MPLLVHTQIPWAEVAHEQIFPQGGGGDPDPFCKLDKYSLLQISRWLLAVVWLAAPFETDQIGARQPPTSVPHCPRRNLRSEGPIVIGSSPPLPLSLRLQ